MKVSPSGRVLACRTRPIVGAVSVSVLLGGILMASLASSADYRIDRMVMTTACAGAEPIYRAPDGSFWVWRGGWRQVSHSTGATCR